MNCLICNKAFTYLGHHVKIDHGLANKEYYDMYLKKENEGVCTACGKETPYLERFNKGYQKTCNVKCSRVPLMHDPVYRAKADKNKSAISKSNWAKNPGRRIIQSELGKKRWKNESYRKIMADPKVREKISKTISNGIKDNPEKYCVNHRTKKGWFDSAKNSDKIYYQSSYELRFFEILEKNNNIIAYKRPDFTIKYIKPTDNRQHRYSADALIYYNDNSRELAEVKANWQIKKDPTTSAKKSAAIAFCLLNNLTYKIYTEDFLFSSIG